MTAPVQPLDGAGALGAAGVWASCEITIVPVRTNAAMIALRAMIECTARRRVRIS